MQPETFDLTSVFTPEVLWTLGGILGLAVVGVLVVWYIRRWTRQPEATPPGGFSLGDLRKLRQDGKISEDEYKRASERLAKVQKEKMLAPRPGVEKKKPAADPKLPER
jgi:hypothetical protein